jgi:predicted TIM-barrel fold metal-dependent hydrolase
MEPPSFTVQELLDRAKPSGVNRVVLIQMSFYGHDNSYMLDAMKMYPGTFSGVAVIDQNAHHPEAQMKELKGQGVRGFRIYPKDVPIERWLDGEGLQAMFKAGGEQNLAMCCLIDPNALPALSKACQKFPDTPVVIDHLCRIGDMARHKNVRVKVSAFYALGKKKPPYLDLSPMIKQVYDAFGPERLMWATDCPYQVVDHSYQQSIDLILHGLDFLTAVDKEWILRTTAEKVFFGK